jgi:hypothetical protein
MDTRYLLQDLKLPSNHLLTEQGRLGTGGSSVQIVAWLGATPRPALSSLEM